MATAERDPINPSCICVRCGDRVALANPDNWFCTPCYEKSPYYKWHETFSNQKGAMPDYDDLSWCFSLEEVAWQAKAGPPKATSQEVAAVKAATKKRVAGPKGSR